MTNIIKDHDNLSIMSFNVHCFEDSCIQDIVKLIKSQCTNGPDIVVFQEVGTSYNMKIKDIFGYFEKLGYIDYIYVPNGASKLGKKNHMTSFVMIISKESFKKKESIDLTVTIHIRNCIVIQTKSNIIIAGVHLEIGERFHHLPEDNALRLQIEKQNSDARIKELEILLLKYPNLDIIIGDFNFSPNDPEFKWLLQKDYIFAKDYEWTTPYNRVDMVFVKKGFIMGLPSENLTLDTNLSDHRPIISKFS